MSTYAGQNLGAGKVDRIRRGMRAALLMAVATSAVISILMLVFGRSILSLFVSGEPDVVQQVLCGKVNKNLVSLLRKAGGRGVGLAGVDGSLFEAVRRDAEHGNVGNIVRVNPDIVLDVLEKGYIPVVSSIAAGIDQTMNYNINADFAAEKLAIALHAKKFILLTDVKGLMRDFSDEDSLIREVKVSQVPGLMKEGVISGGMIPKVQCCVEAIRQGVHTVNIQDGRIPHSILIEILSNEGIGTVFY